MIGRLRGIILEKKPPQAILETHGVGYEIQLPLTCFYALPETGQRAIIFTHFMIRKDSQLLFGFIQKQELILFRELIKVNGIGPKLALAILSEMSAQQLISTIEHQEIKSLIKLPGVGRKTAERLIIEMKDKFKGLSKDLFMLQSTGNISSTINMQVDLSDPENEAVAALVSLGYKPQEASKMVSKVASSGASCEVLIRNALRSTL